jgi:hypothetical protein
MNICSGGDLYFLSRDQKLSSVDPERKNGCLGMHVYQSCRLTIEMSMQHNRLKYYHAFAMLNNLSSSYASPWNDSVLRQLMDHISDM